MTFTRQTWVTCVELLYQYDFYESNDFFTVELNVEVLDLFKKITDEADHLDHIIEKHLFNYSLNRLNKVDKAIIRLAVYLLKHDILPKEIVINEALEVTKMFDDSEDEAQRKFTNKLLDNIANK